MSTSASLFEYICKFIRYTQDVTHQVLETGANLRRSKSPMFFSLILGGLIPLNYICSILLVLKIVLFQREDKFG